MSILKTKSDHGTSEDCKIFIRPVKDVVEIIGGKWTLSILITLSLKNHRFKELERQIVGITPRMLSKELKELELNDLVLREVFCTFPLTVKYSLTEYGKSLDHVLVTMRDWGLSHRKKIVAE